MATKDDITTTDKIPFGAMEPPAKSAGRTKARTSRTRTKKNSGGDTPRAEASPSVESPPERSRDAGQERSTQDNRKDENRRGNSRRGGRRRRKRRPEDGEQGQTEAPRERSQEESNQREGDGEGNPRRRRRRGRPRSKRGNREQRDGQPTGEGQRDGPAQDEAKSVTGMFISEKGGFGTLRDLARQYLPSKQDIYVSQKMVQRHKLRDGSMVEGPIGRGKKYKYQLEGVTSIDGKEPKSLNNLKAFKSLTTIDPDFHYATGDITGEVSMRILDLIAPIGRGQRGLIVAQPRTGKTTLMRQFAKGIEDGYPDVHLMVLLVDERPEEATEWVRSTGGQVFVSTSDESPKNHVKLAEAVWKRCQRLVELGEDVVLILDSLTRLARAYNNSSGGSGRTMSGGLDSRAMERPRQIFGSARNTETAGSLTILGTALIDTGSRMDQLIFEEFKGTGNMEVMLNRKLADRRIFPAIDIEKSGTRKEEKIVSSRRLKRINTLRRVLLRMNFIEAMELLSEKLLDVEKTEDFLQRFDVDPEA